MPLPALLAPGLPHAAPDLTGVAFACFPTDGTLPMEIGLSPDTGGGAADTSQEVIARLDPGEQVFVYHAPPDGIRRWARLRHVGAGVDPSPWTAWTSGVPIVLPNDDATLRAIADTFSTALNDADDITDGATKRITTHSEADGGGRAYGTIDSGGVVVSGGIDLSRPYTGKHLGNVPDDPGSDRHAATANEKTGGARGYGAIDAGGVVVSTGIDLSRPYTGKHLGNVPDDPTSDRRAATANEKTGGARANTAIDAGGVLVPAAIDFSRGYTNKHAGNLPRAAGSGIAIDAVTQHLQDDGHAAATMQDSAGRAINGFFDKVTDLVDDSLFTGDTTKRLATEKYHLPPFVEGVSATTGTYQVTVKAVLRSAIGATVQCMYRTVALGYESNDYSTPTPTAHEALQAQPYPVVLTIDRDSDSASDRTLEFWAQDQYGNVSPIQRVTIPKMTVTDSSNATSSINVVTSFTNGGVCPCFLNDAISWSKAASLPSTWTIELWWDDTGGGAPFSGTLLNSGASLTSYTNGLASAPTGTTRSFNRTYGVRVRNSYAHYLQADTFTPSVAHAGADCAG